MSENDAERDAPLKVGGCYCMSCGLPLPMWSDEPDADLTYDAWLELRCIRCGRTPKENGAMSMADVLRDAERLLVARFGNHLGEDTRARFNIRDQRKQLRLTTSDTLGTFDAWTDRIALNAEVDPLGTAVHELLHANAFADDWLPQDTGREGVVSFRGFEIQHLGVDRTHVYAIYHRGINEGVTELLTRHAYPDAGPAYIDLLPIAQQLATHIGFDRLSALYFRAGYPGLEALIADDVLCELSAAADAHL